MGTNIRVDVTNDPALVPVGMNSIKYLGNSFRDAEKAYHKAETGKDAWNHPNATYGVVLSVWDGQKYVVKMRKGF